MVAQNVFRNASLRQSSLDLGDRYGGFESGIGRKASGERFARCDTGRLTPFRFENFRNSSTYETAQRSQGEVSTPEATVFVTTLDER